MLQRGLYYWWYWFWAHSMDRLPISWERKRKRLFHSDKTEDPRPSAIAWWSWLRFVTQFWTYSLNCWCISFSTLVSCLFHKQSEWNGLMLLLRNAVWRWWESRVYVHFQIPFLSLIEEQHWSATALHTNHENLHNKPQITMAVIDNSHTRFQSWVKW